LSADLGVRWYERRNPTEAGLVGAPASRPAEIAGVMPELLGEFSSRRAEIRERIHAEGARTARGRHVAWAATRAPKASEPYEALVGEWRRRAGVVGGPLEAGHHYLERLSGQAIGLQPSVLDEHRYAAVISVTPHGGAQRRDVVVAVGAAATAGVRAASLDRVVGHWVPGSGSMGVAEPLHPRGAVVPANHLLRALGPRPTDAGAHDIWVEAAHAIAVYRERWGVDRVERADRFDHAEGFGRSGFVGEPLGRVTSLASLPAAQLADHVRTTRLLDTARARLGVRAPVGVELGLEL
jgi:hypothetical protein